MILFTFHLTEYHAFFFRYGTAATDRGMSRSTAHSPQYVRSHVVPPVPEPTMWASVKQSRMREFDSLERIQITRIQ